MVSLDFLNKNIKVRPKVVRKFKILELVKNKNYKQYVKKEQIPKEILKYYDEFDIDEMNAVIEWYFWFKKFEKKEHQNTCRIRDYFDDEADKVIFYINLFKFLSHF